MKIILFVLILIAPVFSWGTCRDNDGTADYVTRTFDAILQPVRATLCMWMKPYGAWVGDSGNYTYLLDTNDDNATNGYTIQTGDDGIYLTFGSVAADQLSTVAFALNTWYHICGSWDGTDMKMYVNGKEEGTFAIGGSPDIAYSGGGFYWGCDNGCDLGGLQEDLYLADLRIYGAALSPVEIQESQWNYNNVVTTNEMRLQWPAWEPDNNPTLQDLSGNNLDGTNSGTVISYFSPPTFIPGSGQ